jgi:hypothetical protein
VELPLSSDEVAQLPHKFTLTSDDGSVTQTLALASDSQAGDDADTVVLTFKNLAEHHTYTLRCDNGDTTYAVFESVDYDQLQSLGPGGTTGTSPSDPSDTGGGNAGPSQASSGADPAGGT